MTGSLTIAIERPEGVDIAALLAASEAFAASLYPDDTTHMLSPEALRDPAVTFLVARLDGRAVGCCALVRRDGYGEIKRMFVHEDARGQGVGQRLLVALEQEAQAARLPLLRLETGTRQPAAQRLYRAAGFRDIPPFGGYEADPVSIFMEKPVAR